MLIRVFLAITMPVADVHGDICAQNDTSPTLCEAPAAWGVGYFYFIFWCSCLLVFNPHPVQIPILHANLVQVQLASRRSSAESARLRGLEQARAGHTQASWCLEGWQEPSDGCALVGACPSFGSTLFALLQSSAVEAYHTRIPAENCCLAKALQAPVGCCELKVVLK